MILSHSQPSRVRPRSSQCPHCREFFSANGLARHLPTHLSSSQPVASSVLPRRHPPLPPSIPPADLQVVNLLDLLMQARSRLRIIKNIPQQSRLAVSSAYEKVICNAVQRKDLPSWVSLLTFPLIVFRLPPGGLNKRQRLGAIVSKNLREFSDGVGLEDILSSQVPDTRSSRELLISRKATRAAQRLSEGDIRAAVRALASDDSIAPMTAETLAELERRHPPPPEDLDMPPIPDAGASEFIRVHTKQVRDAIFSFPMASSGGIDCLRPSHLRAQITPHCCRL